MINLRKTKSLSRIVREWDSIAAIRDEQVRTGKDHSANFVLAPAILNTLPRVRSLVDIGCGTGWLTRRAAQYAEVIVGIDPSHESICIGKINNKDERIRYIPEAVETFSKKSKKFDLAISNMAASSSPELQSFISASRKILKRNALFIFTIPHPCFWPLYWGYASDPRFNYQKSFAVEGDFKIQSENSNMMTTHFHHPLDQYLSTLLASSFHIEEVTELTGRGFRLPRFILIKARAV
ncbi:class I SAM-dependent methyltransferase [Herbaspirillum sp. RU 5E]|uniref:Methyltransferase type 11 domain-containing protein n=1 Tax=Herbaspirillum aquaticum TaxID=568783 RepID=A0A225SX63_9BURK|nr:class I SAM-dependent methyltransferase [Herbaspirillum aquaticum]MBW9332796.1 class I SAM-dependent methyltransferase [Herbaspirillum sp. RU 5E]OWY35801.1 hypothetical protein CEJ45_05190 [Herbaspirillum aquaticum]